MERITQKDLEIRVDRLNEMTGNGTEPYTQGEDGKYNATIGNYHLSYAYGGVALHQMQTNGGGIRDIFSGHMPKRELYIRINALLDGIEMGKD